VTDTRATLLFTMPSLAASINATFHRLPTVYGQPGVTTASPNNPSAAAGGLNQPQGLEFDRSAARNVMYISDSGNHRVLQYELGGELQVGATPMPARVIGQANFGDTLPNRGGTPAANSLYYPLGLACDAQGGLYVVDNGNNRVLYFPFGAENATRVYGQSGSFTTNGLAAVASADSFYYPYGIALATDGVYISDQWYHRVLFFAGNSTAATRVYGQTDFTTWSSGTSASTLNAPRGLVVDSAGGLYIADSGNHRVVYYAPGDSTAALRVYGQGGSFTSRMYNWPSGALSAASLSEPSDLTLAANGTLFISDTTNNRVVAYAPGDSSAAYLLRGQATFTSSVPFTLPPENVLGNPVALRFNKEGSLYVTSFYSHRVIEQL